MWLNPGAQRVPELPTFPWLVLHLRPEQIASLWQSTGASYPRVALGNTRISGGNRAVQPLTIVRDADDRLEVEVSFIKQDGQWTVTGYREEL